MKFTRVKRFAETSLQGHEFSEKQTQQVCDGNLCDTQLIVLMSFNWLMSFRTPSDGNCGCHVF